MSDLYDTDILTWSEEQAALLRRLANNEQVNDQVDWENVVEEIESVGRNQMSAVRSHILQAFLHDLKAAAWPMARDAPHWRSEARRHRLEAKEAYVASMRQRIDLADLYFKALRIMPESNDGEPPLPMPEECPFAGIEEMFADP